MTKTIRTSRYLVALAAAVAGILLAFAASLSLEPPPPVEAQTTTPPTWRLVTDSSDAPDHTFTTVKGLGQGRLVVSYQDDAFEVQRPEFMEIVLSRPFPTLPKGAGMDLAAWHEQTGTQPYTMGTDGYIRRIVNGAVVSEYRLIKAVPVDYRMLQVGDKLTEELELVVEKVSRQQ
jgi:hypothetical protein